MPNDASSESHWLKNRAAVSDLIHRYAFNIRHGKGADCSQLFTEDAVFEVRVARFETGEIEAIQSRFDGLTDITDYLRQVSANSRLCPVIQNLLIDVRGEVAKSTCVMTTIFPPENDIAGEYEDNFQYRDGWLFSSRIFTIYR